MSMPVYVTICEHSGRCRFYMREEADRLHDAGEKFTMNNSPAYIQHEDRVTLFVPVDAIERNLAGRTIARWDVAGSVRLSSYDRDFLNSRMRK